ncbi:MAG: hypothetical protein CMI53_05065 [Parcubacteria group bacterium]|jgi:hypothetical protein|nr:hypothetical protein [Parcubacteria group bacterium]|tara:strand:+ start:3567 stop:3905 length:339 start_codon:yes stop_codon:yes gene_type:complete
MTEERWETIIGHIKDNFELVDLRTEDISEEMGSGSVEIVEFKGPLGLMKLERTTQPMILDKKVIGSRRIGSDATVEYKYSDTEKTHKFTAFKRNENHDVWEEMKMDRGEMLF